MDSKLGQLATVLVLCVLTVGTISVTGLLQSNERIATSGIIIKPAEIVNPPPNPTPPPPEPDVEIDIYSNIGCTRRLSALEWGEITAGEGSNVQIYVKNSGDFNVVLSLATENWSSSTAENYISLSWDYGGSSIQKGEVLPITLTLNVDDDCPKLASFGFDIVIIGS